MLLLAEGFDQYPTGSTGETRGRWITNSGATTGGLNISTAVRAGGVKCLTNPATQPFATLGAGHTTLTIGMYTNRGALNEALWWVTNSFTDSTPDASETQYSLYSAADGSLRFYRGTNLGVLLASSPAGVLAVATWTHVECKVVHATGATGSVEVRVNGNPTPVLTVTGVQTLALAAGVYYFAPAFTGGTHYVDDLTITSEAATDAAGNASALTGFAGPCQVKALAPASDDTTEWTPSTPGSHFGLVDERGNAVSDDGDTSYVESDVAGERDLFGLAALGVEGGVVAVQVSVVARKPTDGTSMLKLVHKLNGVSQAQSTGQALTTSFSAVRASFERRPDSPATAFTSVEIAALKVGVEVV